MIPPLVTGTLVVDGAERAGEVVQLFAAEPGERPRLLASGVTDARGAFALEPAGGDVAGRAIVLAKLKGDPVGAVAAEVELPRPAAVALLADGPFFVVTGTVESDAGLPAELALALDPVRPEGVPEQIVPFLNQKAVGVFDGRYAALAVTPPSFSLRLQRGVWRLRGESIDYDRPNVAEPAFRNYVTAEARSEPGGARLPGSPTGGFELDVDGDRGVTLVLRELRDDEL